MFVLKKASKGSAAAWKQTRKQAMTMGAYCVAVRFAYLVCNWGR